MDWYKKAQNTLETFEDRNRLNERIRFFKKMIGTLLYMKKYVYQNAPHARKILLDFYENKVMSSFPGIRDILKEAIDRSLDNYGNFAEICQKAVDKLYEKIKEMEQERLSR